MERMLTRLMWRRSSLLHQGAAPISLGASSSSLFSTAQQHLILHHDAATAAPTHLHFYFHDTVSGKSPTAVRMVDPPTSSSSSPMSMFEMVNVMDDPLTEGPDQAKIGFLQAMNLVFTSRDFNGSTLALLGRNCALDAIRELPVVGGTGAFRFARGYAQLRTRWLDFRAGDATVEYDVYVMH